MPSTASTSSHDPAPAPPPPDERMPLSSVPDLTKFFPPLIQDAICAEMNRGADGVYYDEFEQLYWMYSGWEEVREAFERVWRPMAVEWEEFRRRQSFVRSFGNAQARAALAHEYSGLIAAATRMSLLRQGPAGLAILRQRHFARHPKLNYARRLTSLPSLHSRRDTLQRIAETLRSSAHKLTGYPVLGL
ncbi:hypothetical protein NBRC10512_006651 [Rhodotorula toruloides]